MLVLLVIVVPKGATKGFCNLCDRSESKTAAARGDEMRACRFNQNLLSMYPSHASEQSPRRPLILERIQNECACARGAYLCDENQVTNGRETDRQRERERERERESAVQGPPT